MFMKNVDNYIDKAEERLQMTMQSHCMHCRKNLALEKQGRSQDPLTSSVKVIISNPDLKKTIPDHLLCKDCLMPAKSEIHYAIKQDKSKLKSKTMPIKCAICRANHEIEMKYLRVIFKGDDGACCQML